MSETIVAIETETATLQNVLSALNSCGYVEGETTEALQDLAEQLQRFTRQSVMVVFSPAEGDHFLIWGPTVFLNVDQCYKACQMCKRAIGDRKQIAAFDNAMCDFYPHYKALCL